MLVSVSSEQNRWHASLATFWQMTLSLPLAQWIDFPNLVQKKIIFVTLLKPKQWTEFPNLVQTSPKGFSASMCHVGNWIFSKSWEFLGNF